MNLSKRLLKFILLGLMVLGSALAQELPRNETLYIGGFQWGPPTSYNPVGSGSAWPSGGNLQYIYETLFGYNLLTGNLDPQLAASLETPDTETMVVTLHDGTRWQDGEALTSADVVYTFEMAKRQPVSYATFWDYVTSLTADDDKTVTLKLNPEKLNPGLVKQNLANVAILPEHIWSGLEESEESLLQYANMTPVGSGPYKLREANNERVVLERDDNYWGKDVLGMPAPRYVVHPIFKSNDAGNLALEQGQLDISQQFAPEIWKMWEEKGLPISTWFKEEPYHVPGSIPLMFVNVNAPGLSDPQVRRAIAYAINYPLIAQTAMSRYSVPANSSLIIPDGGEAKFFDAELVAQNGWSYNPQMAVDILEKELGAKKGGDGIYVLADGTRLGPWKVQCPFGWTDWNQALEIVAANAQAVGIDIQVDFPEFPVANQNMANGTFDLALWYVAGVGPASPWQRFRDVMDNRGVPPVGETAFWGYNRYSNPEVGELLDEAAAADEARQKELFAQLDQIFMADVPAIPLMYRPLEFYEFNESHWTGFPTAENPTAPPMFQGAGIKVLYNLTAK
jgi:peptide/nickel transport system substrate-binding protein